MTLPIPWTIEDILAATDGELVSATDVAVFSGLAIDSRRIRENEAFVAIPGQRHDGHDFLSGVVASGVKCVIVRDDKVTMLPISQWRAEKVACIAVKDTIKALGAMAAYQCRRAEVSVAAVTGSNGKTTTKEMIAAVLGRCYNVLATPGNFNNEIGLPLTLLQLAPEHQAAVVELGMNHPGEIAGLSAICRPDIGVITNIAPAHLAGLGSIKAVAAAKAEIMENVKPDGAMVLNSDDDYGSWLASQTDRRVMFYGCGDDADIRAEDIGQDENGLCFTLVLPGQSVRVELRVRWSFMVHNALAAAAVGHLMGVSAEDIAAGLAGFRPISGRMAVYRTESGAYIIDDTYNSNPGSMETAIKSLASLGDRKRGILVAGDMLELGEAAAGLHEDIGRLAAISGINRLYLAGEFASRVAYGARCEGMKGMDIFVGSRDDIVKDLQRRLESGDWILVKGSRSTGMDEIVARLTANARIHATDSAGQEAEK
ncbi:MAG: UDP-N-acetylmuramoyl-tripeptide--D-alanyl-D-alanine ligase [Desulfobacteraceae bacterium]|nr:UDP-N-acetylmuramoyl-tripeptide--D-alanyl-D-alanine ligase [Desulfobacteraceae bacterium]